MNDICANVIDLAKRQLGYKEKPDNNTKYSRYFDVEAWQWFNTKKNPGTDWCAIFVCWLFCQNENLGPKQAYEFLGCPKSGPKDNCAAGVPFFFDYLKNKGYKVDKSKGQPGDIIVLNNKKHVGIIEKIEDGYYITIEGNKGNYVAHGSYKISSSYITGIFHPKWENAHFYQKTTTAPVKPDDKEQLYINLAKKCIQGFYGNGLIRKKRINSLGHGDIYSKVQNYVNLILAGKVK